MASSIAASAAVSAVASAASRPTKDDISLASWSLNRSFRAGKWKNLDLPRILRETLDINGLLAHARAGLANYKRPKSIEQWPELPKSGANKILRREVRDRIIARDRGSNSQ